MNPLNDYPSIRKALYLLQWLTTGATGVLGVVYASQGDAPQWYTVTVAALAFVWTYTGVTAQQNVDKPADDERGEIGLVGILIVVLIVIAAVAVLR